MTYRTRKHKHRSRRNKTNRKRGGASLVQIGKASAMRSWVQNPEDKEELNLIVHSADKTQNFLGRTVKNPYADVELQSDIRAEEVLRRLNEEYQTNLNTYLRKKAKKTDKTTNRTNRTNRMNIIRPTADITQFAPNVITNMQPNVIKNMQPNIVTNLYKKKSFADIIKQKTTNKKTSRSGSK